MRCHHEQSEVIHVTNLMVDLCF